MGTVESLIQKTEEKEQDPDWENDFIDSVFDAPQTIELKIDRTGIQGLDPNKSDADVVVDWIKQTLTIATEAGADPITHFIMHRIMTKFENLNGRESITLNGFELALIRWSLLSTRLPGKFNKMFVIICRIFGLSL